jgi:hypothetical protein
MNWNTAALICSVGGSCLGMCGTMMMAHAYHANTLTGYVILLFHLPFIAMRGWSAVRDFWNEQARGGRADYENRAYSLSGLALIFRGFLLQVLGSVCSFMGGK